MGNRIIEKIKKWFKRDALHKIEPPRVAEKQSTFRGGNITDEEEHKIGPG